MYGPQQVFGPTPSMAPQQGYSPTQVSGATAYFPMQTSTGFDMNSMMNMMMMIMVMSMMVNMMKGVTSAV